MEKPSFKILFLFCYLLLTADLFGQTNDYRIFNDSLLKISEISLNSFHSDFGPCVINDSLYFTTFNDKLAKSSDNILKKKEFYDLYKAKIDKNGNPVSEREPVDAFVTQFNDGPVSWCEKTGELFVTQNDPELYEKAKGFQKEIVRLKIAISKKINGKWGPLVDFPFNSKKYSVGHPAINMTGDTLIFTSDIPGGFGETDLYYSVRRNGKWGLPVNLGPQINTSGKDEFPFLTDQHLNGRFLVFASNGRFGNGGFDLYYTRFPSDFKQIEHFDLPINSAEDDFAMTIPADAEYGYLTSNRQGSGNDDIYKFDFKRLKKIQAKNPDHPLKSADSLLKTAVIPKEISPKLTEVFVFDRTSLRPIPGAKIVSCDNQVFLTDEKGKTTFKTPTIPNCELVASSFGYPEIKKMLISFSADPVLRDTIWMNILTDQKIILHNIYYNFDKYDILPESARELDRLVGLMKQNPEMDVELSSHTDSRGSEAYNQNLSELRSKAAADYLILKGINRDRITWKGYGKSRLINTCIEPCTPDQQRENRRTELFIPGFSRGEAVKQSEGYNSTKENLQRVTPSDSNLKKVEKNTSESNKVQVSTAPGKLKYYVVLGSFKEEGRASIFIRQLKSEGIDAVILGKNEPVRVGIGYQLLNQAMKSLTDLRVQHEKAWILVD